jgi:cyanate permease
MTPEDVVTLRKDVDRLKALAILACLIGLVGIPFALWIANPIVYAMLAVAVGNAISLGVLARFKQRRLREATAPPQAKLLR